MSACLRLAALIWIAQICVAQTSTLRVFSEFTRVDPFGEVVPQDRGSAEPRTILSPGVPRNAYSSFRIVLTFDKPAKYVLDIGQNPENAVKSTLYRERFEKHGEQWIPDGLEQVKIPYEGEFSGTDIPGQKAITFWLDAWVAKTAPVSRIKVEPQVWVSYANDWFTYPMEVRILNAVLPAMQINAVSLPAITERADTPLLEALRAAYCGAQEKAGDSTLNGRALIRRNVLPLIAAKKAALGERLGTNAWCAGGKPPASEWFLKIRDSLLQTSSR